MAPAFVLHLHLLVPEVSGTDMHFGKEKKSETVDKGTCTASMYIYISNNKHRSNKVAKQVFKFIHLHSSVSAGLNVPVRHQIASPTLV